MNELIPINYEKEIPTVSGRELHAALEVDTPYNKWFPRMIEYGFSDNKDFWTFLSESTGGRPSADHAITIPMAKELCMLQRTAKGKQFREYFIKCEESWNSPEKIMERAFYIAQQRALAAERRIMGLEKKTESLEIALNTANRYYTVARYNAAFHKNWNMSQCQFVGKGLTLYCRSNGVTIRKCSTNDERFGLVNSYPIEAWERFLRNHPFV
jgi:phage anti-repressor protein